MSDLIFSSYASVIGLAHSQPHLRSIAAFDGAYAKLAQLHRTCGSCGLRIPVEENDAALLASFLQRLSADDVAFLKRLVKVDRIGYYNHSPNGTLSKTFI